MLLLRYSVWLAPLLGEALAGNVGKRVSTPVYLSSSSGPVLTPSASVLPSGSGQLSSSGTRSRISPSPSGTLSASRRAITTTDAPSTSSTSSTTSSASSSTTTATDASGQITATMFDGYIVTCTSAHVTTYDGHTRQECVGQQGMIGIDTAMFDSYYSSKTTTSTSKTTTTSATPTYTEAYWIAQGYQYKRNDPDGDWTIYWMTFHSDSGDTSKQPDWCEKSVQKSKLGKNYELVNSKKTPKSLSYKKSSDKNLDSCEYSNKDDSLDGTFTCTASDHLIHADCTGEFPKSFIENWCKDTLWIYTPTAVCLIGPDDHGK